MKLRSNDDIGSYFEMPIEPQHYAQLQLTMAICQVNATLLLLYTTSDTQVRRVYRNRAWLNTALGVADVLERRHLQAGKLPPLDVGHKAQGSKYDEFLAATKQACLQYEVLGTVFSKNGQDTVHFVRPICVTGPCGFLSSFPLSY
jgi:hypothetical protein